MTESITDLVRALETERDDLRARVTELSARCEAQELVIARVRSLVDALEDYAERQAAFAAQLATADDRPEPAPAKRAKSNPRMARRYTDDDVHRWRFQLQQGVPLGTLAEREDVRPETILRRVSQLREEATATVPPEPPPPPMAPIVHTCAQRGHFGNVQVLEAGERMRGGMSVEDAAAFFYTDVPTLQAGLRRLEMDPDSGRFLNRPSEEELLRQHVSYLTDDEEEPEDERIAEAV
jgi:hypothetical protein